MKRRVFLSKLAVSLAAIVSVRAFAQTHDMSKMNHSGHDMSSMSGMNMGKMNHVDLLPITGLPSNQPLAELKLLHNLSTKPNEFKATLHAKAVTLQLTPEIKTEFWAYNDQIPGPAIEVFEGDTVTITLKNDLPQPTTIHWHGLPVPADQDGNPQDEVPSGASRDYTFTLPLGCAGTYWYHPHGHGTVAEQVFRGLAGVFIVKAKQDVLAHIPSQNWLISDLRLAADGSIPENSMMDWMDGREGQFVLLNGMNHPHISLNVATRVRVWNACSARYLNLSLVGADIYLIGTDGGLIEKPQKITQLLLSPAERAELLIVPNKQGHSTLQALAYERGKMMPMGEEVTRHLASVSLVQSTMPQLPDVLRVLPVFGAAVATKVLKYTEIMQMGKGMDFLINGKKHDPNRIDLVSKVGDVEEWVISNDSDMDHNFHIHGTQFLHIKSELNGQEIIPEFAALRDTLNIKKSETVHIKIIQDKPGLRMYHCHILEHETQGMMGQVNVI